MDVNNDGSEEAVRALLVVGEDWISISSTMRSSSVSSMNSSAGCRRFVDDCMSVTWLQLKLADGVRVVGVLHRCE